jgi:hypothetical protein
MKILGRFFMLVLAVALTVGMSGFVSQDNNAAMVIHEDTGCSIYDFDYDTGHSASIHRVINNGGNTTLVCKAQLLPRAGASVFNGFPCYANGILTYDSQLTVSASGKATLRCQIKKD